MPREENSWFKKAFKKPKPLFTFKKMLALGPLHLLAHLTSDLSQAEKKISVVTS